MFSEHRLSFRNPTFTDWRRHLQRHPQTGVQKSVAGNPTTDFCYVLRRALWGRGGESVKIGFVSGLVSRSFSDHSMDIMTCGSYCRLQTSKKASCNAFVWRQYEEMRTWFILSPAKDKDYVFRTIPVHYCERKLKV